MNKSLTAWNLCCLQTKHHERRAFLKEGIGHDHSNYWWKNYKNLSCYLYVQNRLRNLRNFFWMLKFIKLKFFWISHQTFEPDQDHYHSHQKCFFNDLIILKSDHFVGAFLAVKVYKSQFRALYNIDSRVTGRQLRCSNHGDAVPTLHHTKVEATFRIAF